MRLAAVILAAWMLVVSSVVATTTALGAKPKKTGVWEIVEGEFAGRQTCMAIGSADQATILTLKLDTGHMADQIIALLLYNKDWSIKEGDDLGDLRFHAGDEIAGAEPVAGSHGFFFYMSLDPAERWFGKTKASGFWIERNGKEIARYRGGNLAETFQKIRACGEKLIKADPFAGMAAAKASSPEIDSISLVDAAVTAPKPVGLPIWIGAIQRDYFLGPLGGSDIRLRRDRRNSTPAALRFKMTVDALGKMISCEVIATTGLKDWSDEFCSLAQRYPLAFAPALSAAGTPVRGEYVTSAVVAFE